MYNIFIVEDHKEIKGDVSLVENMVSSYTDDPSFFINGCKKLKEGEILKFGDRHGDLIIVKKI